MSGIRADFKLSLKSDCTIFQSVHMAGVIGGETFRHVFTEAWTSKCRGRKSCGINQNGTDSFLITDADVERASGEVKFWTSAWIELEPLDKVEFCVGSGTALWGSLYGRMGARTAPKGTRKLDRKVLAKWKKMGPIVWAAEV
jgi:hypothetical protein